MVFPSRLPHSIPFLPRIRSGSAVLFESWTISKSYYLDHPWSLNLDSLVWCLEKGKTINIFSHRVVFIVMYHGGKLLKNTLNKSKLNNIEASKVQGINIQTGNFGKSSSSKVSTGMGYRYVICWFRFQKIGPLNCKTDEFGGLMRLWPLEIAQAFNGILVHL